MGVRLLTALAATLVLAGTAEAATITDGARYLIQHRKTSGGFAEPGRAADPALTGWAILGLRASGHCPGRSGTYLRGKRAATATDLELRILALDALRDHCAFTIDLRSRIARLQGLRHANGRIGPSVNSTIWGVLALRATGRRAGGATVAYLLERRRPNGGWPWYPGGKADSNDTAAAIQALRSAGVGARSRAVNRGVNFLRGLQNRDGGFELTSGRGSDTQSTAWAVQALIAASRAPGPRAYAYLHRMQRSDGSFRYNAGFVTTPVWVTSQAIAALARKPFPLK